MCARTPALLLIGALLGLGGCGGPRVTALDTCIAEHGDAATARILPVCVNTEEGPMPTDGEYIAGVVECELGWLAKYPAALMAQAVAARTYLAAYLDRKGPRAEVPIGAHFQCWRHPTKDRSRIAAEATSDIVLHYQATLINGNYVSGARKLGDDCTALPPTESGYRHRSWEQMRDDYLAWRARGKRRPYSGIYWTEVLVTRNAGRSGEAVEGTLFASPGPKNRGALGQYAAACLAEKGYDTQAILKYFYGEDIAFSRALPDVEPAGLSPLEEDLPELDIPISMNLR
ncbi:MAG: hypothetical protein H6706_23585 [Myxococcales bacterium]|nr:hypothetical protein [Myxococcales bacterium]